MQKMAVTRAIGGWDRRKKEKEKEKEKKKKKKTDALIGAMIMFGMIISAHRNQW